MLFEALSQYKPTLPSKEQVQSYVAAISAKYPFARNVGFACDGAKFAIQTPPGDIQQSIFYNGWTRGHYVSCIFVFAPDGTIPICALNAPGCLHDSTVAFYGDVYKSLEQLYDEFGVKTVVDSAFRIGNGNFLLKSSQTDPQEGPDERGHELLLQNRHATSVRQLSEWGMHQIRCKFPRMDDTLKYETRGQRVLDLSLMIRLYNHQCQSIGMNQILNTFMAHQSAEVQYFATGIFVDNNANYIAESLAGRNIQEL